MNGIVESLVVPLVAVAPGFVLVAVYRRNRYAPDPSDARFAASALVASIFPHAVFLFWTVRVLAPIKEGGLVAIRPFEALLWIVVVVFVAPALIGLAASSVVDARRIQPLFEMIGWTRTAKSAWDWIFQPANPLWLKVRLRDGTVVGGLWDEDSVATLGPEPRELYIKEPYVVSQEGFERRLRGRLWIDGSEIAMMEVFDTEV